jgi:hypothetical protein
MSIASCNGSCLFAGALDALASFGEPINRVLEVAIDGDQITFNFYDLPPSSI